MTAQRSIFRKVALERLSSPEQLDQLLQVTSPRAWLGLLALLVFLGTLLVWSVVGRVPISINASTILLQTGGVKQVVATGGGKIDQILVAAGDPVMEGQLIAQIVSLDGTQVNEVISPFNGQILEVRTSPGSFIDLGTPVVNLEQIGESFNLEAIAYVPAVEGKGIEPGMLVQIAPSTIQKEEYGFMIGRVTSVSPFPATYRGMLATLGSEELVQAFSAIRAPLQVKIELLRDDSTVSGYRWSSQAGPPFEINSGTLGTADIIVGEERPLQYVLP